MTAFYEGCFHLSHVIKIHIFTGESIFTDYLINVKHCRYRQEKVFIEHLPCCGCSARCIYYTFVSCGGGATGRERRCRRKRGVEYSIPWVSVLGITGIHTSFTKLWIYLLAQGTKKPHMREYYFRQTHMVHVSASFISGLGCSTEL